MDFGILGGSWNQHLLQIHGDNCMREREQESCPSAQQLQKGSVMG